MSISFRGEAIKMMKDLKKRVTTLEKNMKTSAATSEASQLSVPVIFSIVVASVVVLLILLWLNKAV